MKWLTASTSMTNTRMLLAKTKSMEMMLNARMALSPMKKSTRGLRLRYAARVYRMKTYKHEEEAS